MSKDENDLSDAEKETRNAWELVSEIVLRVPNER
jgi:hypothetical protein